MTTTLKEQIATVLLNSFRARHGVEPVSTVRRLIPGMFRDSFLIDAQAILDHFAVEVRNPQPDGEELT